VSQSTSDEILMAAYQAGNQAAFTELFERHAGSVYGFLVRRLGDNALAEDLYQEAFLRLHRARHTYDSGRPFRAWLFTIVHNLLNDALRRRRRTSYVRSSEEATGKSSPDGIHGESEREVGSDEHSPERLLAARQSTQALERALNALPSDEATVLILARVERMSYDDIGAVIGRSATATKQLAYRALKRLRGTLAAWGHSEEP
jgi:RNA polymerase sigma-70 factor (ECF subfamily)